VDDERWRCFENKREALERERARLKDVWVRPGSIAAAGIEGLTGEPLRREVRALDLLMRPRIGYDRLTTLEGIGASDPTVDAAVAEQLEIQCKYAGYVDRQHAEIARAREQEARVLPTDFDYDQVRGLSTEVMEKLRRVRPTTIGQASRIPGVTPAAVSLLLIHLKRLSA
jgi:tRNA uridine 5-carboxymethylaminomethyl modification enzyme